MPELHSPFGYSAVSTYEQCPFRYKCQYIDGLKTLPSDEAANPLIIGTALHKAIETDIDTAIQEYFNSFPIITDQHIDEEIKLRYMVPKVKEMLPSGIHEVQVIDRNFMGTLDLLVPVNPEDMSLEEKDDICFRCPGGTLHCDYCNSGRCPKGKYEGFYDLYDFKYSNNWMRYMDSRQLHLYKYYFEKMNPGKRIRNLFFLFVPKIQIRQKKTETIFDFRQRLIKELAKVQPKVESIQYDPQKVIDHLELTQLIAQETEYSKNPTRLCQWCDYKNLCESKGEIDMALPSTNRVPTNLSAHKKIWIYGAPFSGKTTVCDAAPTPLNLNTDGNVKAVTMARLPIRDTMDGRQKKLAWEIFRGAIDDLEAGSDFETIVVDLLEDTYESCRLWMYKQMDITHESEDGFRAWDKVRTEFLSTFRRLLNLPYNIILISHEDMSKDITKRSGDKVTAIRPNIQDKIANKIAGMVDIVCRVLVEDNGRYLSFKSDAVVFGGGRITGHGKTQIPLSWDAIEDFYASVGGQKPQERKKTTAVAEEPIQTEIPLDVPENAPADDLNDRLKAAMEKTQESMGEEPKRRTRRTRN